MVFLSLPTKWSHSHNYFVMNPFTNEFKNIGPIRIGDWGLFLLFENLSSSKYEWVVQKHMYDKMQSKIYVFSSLHKVSERVDLLFGVTSTPKNVVFCKSNLFSLYMDKEYEKYPWHGYTIYWLRVIKNEWDFSFVRISDIRCIILAIYMD